MRSTKSGLVAVFGVLVTALLGWPAASATPADCAQEVVRLINQERRARRLYPYRVNAVLETIALAHNVCMCDNDCFDHVCPGEASVAERACATGYEPYGWGACYVAETIAAGYTTPSAVVTGWMNSPGHRAILLDDKLREIGVSYLTGGGWGTYWTADFGSQPDVLPIFINGDDPQTDTRDVTLILTNEEVSGWGGIDYATQVMASDDPGFSGASWQAYAAELRWILAAGGGVKMVYVKYRDATGYEVISNDEIELAESVEFAMFLPHVARLDR
jgi:uncharacterized protein YkwD